MLVAFVSSISCRNRSRDGLLPTVLNIRGQSCRNAQIERAFAISEGRDPIHAIAAV
jgi:hypothetical protein